MSSTPQILMCPPDYFGVDYEINPWMNRRRRCDHRLAVRQWERFRDLLEEAGATIACLAPVPGLPDLVFTANAALIYRDMAILSRFTHPERRGEEQHDLQWLERRGFHVVRLPGGAFFEGAGDALFCGDTLFAGYRIRSQAIAHQEVAALLDCRVIPLELVDPYCYHLDTCFCPLAPDIAVYYPEAFDDYARRALTESIADLIPVSREEARRFACNAAVVGRTVITNVGCPELGRQFQRRGFTAWETPLGEFVKAGGGGKCLTLRLDGEDAASWKEEMQAVVGEPLGQ